MPPKRTKRVPSKPGKSKKKISEKEIARRAAAEAEKQRLSLVKNAETVTATGGKSAVKDVMAGLKPYSLLTKGDTTTSIEFAHPGTMEATTKDWCLDLVRRNMKQQYLDARWGWSDGEKRKELEDSHARYLVCRVADGGSMPAPEPSAAATSAAPADSTPTDEDGAAAKEGDASKKEVAADPAAVDSVVRDSKGELVAYVHFRFMLEGSAPVLYVFEIQCEPRMRGKGLGSHMMKALELVAYQEKMHYVMLTVFAANKGAKRFYKRLGYDLDELSKSPAMLSTDVPYQILSKCIDPEVAKAKLTRHKALQEKIHGDKAPEKDAFAALAAASAEASAAKAAAAEAEEEAKASEKATSGAGDDASA